LYDAIFIHGYTDCYENIFKEFSTHTPANINIPIRKFLARQKLKTPGNLFPLTDFVRQICPKIFPSRYILVDFWYSGCARVFAQFRELKETYKNTTERDLKL